MENRGQETLTGQEPIELGEGKNMELVPVEAEDIDRITKLNKDALRVFAYKKFGINLDLSSHIIVIRGDLIKKCQIALGIILEDPETDEETKAAIGKVVPRYVKNPKNKRVFDATPALLKRDDLVPCDEDGTPLKASEYFIPEAKPAFNSGSKSEMERLAAGMETQIER